MADNQQPVSMEVSSIAQKKREIFRQRPVSQMFHPKSLAQFFGSEQSSGNAGCNNQSTTPTTTNDGGKGPVSSSSSTVRSSTRPHSTLSSSLPTCITAEPPEDLGASGRRPKERWSLLTRVSGMRNTLDLLRDSGGGNRSPRETEASIGGGEASGGGAGTRPRGLTEVALSHPATSPRAAEEKKRSSTLRLVRMIGEVSRGKTPTPPTLPQISPRPLTERQKEHERILADAEARQTTELNESGGSGGDDDEDKWLQKRKSLASKGSKRNMLLNSLGSPRDGLLVGSRKKAGKESDSEEDGMEGDADGEEECEEEAEEEMGTNRTKSKGIHIRKRTKSFFDLNRVSKIVSSPPTKKEISSSASDLRAVNETYMFGSGLQEIMDMQKHLEGLDIPIILVALTSALVKLGTSQEGIFRVPGNKSRVETLKARIAEGDYDFEDSTAQVHDLASLLKEWLQSLKDPIIPISFYAKCVASVSKPKKCIAVVEEIPQPNRSVLKYIITFLQTHILRPEIQKATRMDIKSIATAFAPCLMRSPEVSDMQEMMSNIQQEIKFVVNLLILSNSSVAGE